MTRSRDTASIAKQQSRTVSVRGKKASAKTEHLQIIWTRKEELAPELDELAAVAQTYREEIEIRSHNTAFR